MTQFKTIRQILIIITCVGLLIFNIYLTSKNITQQISQIQRKPMEPGFDYKDIYENIALLEKQSPFTTVGYLTNKDMTPEGNDGEFLRAQYMMAPFVLDLDNDQHPISILSFTEKILYEQKIKTMNAVPIFGNEYGKLITIRKSP